jgi:hypothetical protein
MTVCRTHAPCQGNTTVDVHLMKTWTSFHPLRRDRIAACMNRHCLVNLLPRQAQAPPQCQPQRRMNLYWTVHKKHCLLRTARWATWTWNSVDGSLRKCCLFYGEYFLQTTQLNQLCASVLVKSGLENRDYGRGGSAALTMRHPSVRKSWYWLRRWAASSWLVWFARRLKLRS